MNDELLTRQEVADRLKIGRNKAYQMLRDGEIPSIKVGPEFRVKASVLEAWIAAGGNAQVAK